MRVIILILHLVFAYMLLSGWPESLPVWLRAGLALIVVMLAMPMSDVASRRTDRVKLISVRATKWLDYITIGIIFFGIELLLLALFTLGPETTEKIHEDVKYWLVSDERAVNGEQDAPSELSHEGAGNWLWDNHFSRSHPTEANNRPPNKPEIFMEVKSSYSQKVLQKNNIYLRTFALDRFDGVTWSIHRPLRLVIDRSGSNVGDESSKINLSSVIIGASHGLLPVHEHRITQPFYGDGQNILTTLHHTISVNIETITKVNTDTYTLPILSEKLYDGKEAASYSYSARSQPLLYDAIVEFDQQLKVGDTKDVYFSKVNNSSLQSKLTDFVSGIDKNLPLVEKLSAIKQLINEQCSYSLVIKNEEKINPLENFLFVEKSGYCEFYASATAMLCREFDIPSRIAFGWSGGKFYESSDLFVFRSKDAHAWTEVYLDGYGWVIFDTTPAIENAITESEGGEEPPEVEDMIGGVLVDEGYELEEERGWISWSGVLYTMIGLFTLLFGLLLIRRFTQPAQDSISATYVKEEPKYLQIFQMLSAKLGQPAKPGSTLMQNVKAVQEREFDVPGLADLLDEILTYHYDATYRNLPADKSKENRFASELKKITKRVEG